MLAKDAAIKYSRDFLRSCSVLPIKIDKAILFGSAISGTATKNSDIDLALFSRSFTENILQNLDLIAQINIRYPELDIRTYPTSAYTTHSLLLDEIKLTGIEINL